MQFSAREDIEAPLERVFDAVTDYEAIERQAMRRGIDVSRTDDLSSVGEGLTWTARFRFRGRQRDATITLTRFDRPQGVSYHSVSGGLEVETVIETVALSRSRTRIGIDVTLMPKTLSARLLVQSLKLAKSNIDKRFRKRMSEYARHLEERLKSSA